MNKSSLHTRSFRLRRFSVFRYKLIEKSFAGPKLFRGFQETGRMVFDLNMVKLEYERVHYSFESVQFAIVKRSIRQSSVIYFTD